MPTEQELIDAENIRLAEEARIVAELEAERIANLNARFQAVYEKDCGMPGFIKHYPEVSNCLWHFNEIIMKSWLAADQEAFVALMETESLSSVREQKLESIRYKRNDLLDEADILINKAFDEGLEALSALKAYRIQLRDITEVFKADMSLLDNIDVDAVVFPEKP
jgi:hypothetical protein